MHVSTHPPYHVLQGQVTSQASAISRKNRYELHTRPPPRQLFVQKWLLRKITKSIPAQATCFVHLAQVSSLVHQRVTLTCAGVRTLTVKNCRKPMSQQ